MTLRCTVWFSSHISEQSLNHEQSSTCLPPRDFCAALGSPLRNLSALKCYICILWYCSIIITVLLVSLQLVFLDFSLCLFFFLPGLATAVKSLLWSKMAAPPLPRLPPLPHNLCDDDDSPPAFAAC